MRNDDELQAGKVAATMMASCDRVVLSTYPGLDERVVIIRSRDVVDAVFVRTKRFNVLVDTLDTPESCRTALDLLGDVGGNRPLIVVNSHMDWDHFWGNSAIAGQAAIIAHERALLRFKDPRTRGVLRQKAQEDARFAHIELVAPTVTFADTLRLEGGDLTLELFATPGHTPDHVSIWIPEIRVCLAIDAVENPIPEVWSADRHDLDSLVKSLSLIQHLNADHVVLAHGRTNSPAVIDQNLRYFEMLCERGPRLCRDGWAFEASEPPDGLRLADLVPLPPELSAETRSFYESCHRSNLRAVLSSR